MTKENIDMLLAIVQVVVLLVQIASLIALIIYVKKTAEMAEATKDMAVATRKSAEMSDQMALVAQKSADATVRAAKAAEDSVIELQETREQESAPYVVAYFDASPETALIYLVVKNIGKMFANQVKLDFQPSLQNSTEGIEISDIPLIKDGIGSIPPGYEIRTLFDRAISYFGNENMPLSYTVRISYIGGIRDQRRDYEQTLDLGAFIGLGDIHQRGFNDLVQQIEGLGKSQTEINKTLQSLLRSVNEGIWLRNQDFIIRNADSVEAFLPVHVLSKLNEFRDFWLSIRDSEEEINLVTIGIQAKCKLISEQIIAFSSNRPVNASKETVDDLMLISAKLSELGRMRFYLDGGRSDEKFISLANSIIEKIIIVEKRLLAEMKDWSAFKA